MLTDNFCRYHELAREIKHNKGGILRATGTYVKLLKSDQQKKKKLEEICHHQNEQIEQMIKKIQVSKSKIDLHYITCFV